MSAAQPSWIERAQDFLSEGLWTRDPHRSPVGIAVGLGQFAVMVGEGFFLRHRLPLRASALTYVAMLSLLPLIALALGIADALGTGLSDRLAPLIVGQIAVGSPQAEERILALLANVDFGGLGTQGAAVLFFTTVLAIGQVERALNEIWGPLPQRPWMRRIPDYLAVLVIAPILLGVALVVGAGLQSEAVVRELQVVPGFAPAYKFGLRQMPTVLLCAGFTFLYWFLPNTSVRVLSAVLGGLVAALLFVAAQGLYVELQVGVARANAVFGTFAALPLLLVWIYLSCAIMLLGAEVAYAHQHLALYRREVRGRDAGPAAREEAGLAIAAMVARRFRDGGPPLTADQLSAALGIPVRTLREILVDLDAAGLVVARGERDLGELQLGRPAEHIAVGDILRVLRGPTDTSARVSEVAPVVLELMGDLDRAETDAAQGRTLLDLVEKMPQGEPRPASAQGKG